MGLQVENSMAVFKGKSIVAYSWNHGNEYTMTLEDIKGETTRVRVPAYMKEMFEQYFAITMGEEEMIHVNVA
jgi:hypothetical protein